MIEDNERWTLDLLRKLIERDEYEKRDTRLFHAFQELNDRLHQKEVVIGQHGEELPINQSQTREINKLAALLDKKEMMLQSQKKRISDFESREKQMSNKIHALKYELQEKNKAIQIANDEILMGQIQLNLLTEKAEKLTRENENLVTRWMERVKLEADQMNEVNEFLKQKST
ncbi:uncharacterized protein KQ657_000915 [Scheffersomyces spartinae]|uniref:Autophagy-related protein 16 domain-containing protein n=1 Tax=Scheffersomyces spartinae TaxID=45513 RepID=A0A9P7V8C9_9ASCO|nr:uncharacterized protein KQ657_000915 [Scheffersomyces spartinae]KAG7193161.1 hypothetical protein KQ657_000915 [Scheffersomyces spartinae]